jgi:hypothetical protein
VSRCEADGAALGEEHVEHAHDSRLGPEQSRLRVELVPSRCVRPGRRRRARGAIPGRSRDRPAS